MPTWTKKLKPNSLGYFDFYGKWNEVGRIDVTDDLKAFGLTATTAKMGTPDITVNKWEEPLCSKSVRATKIFGEGQAGGG